MIFSLIHPTDRLPNGWQKAARDWLRNCDDPRNVEYILVTNEMLASEERTGIFPFAVGLVTTETGSAPMWNWGAVHAHGEILIGIADDLFSCPHWDTELLKVVPSDPDAPFVIEVDHADASDLLTHCFISRAYYKRFGYMHHPDYKHLMADVEFTDLARESGALINARHLTFPHLKPDQMGWEPRYERVRNDPAEYDAAKALYARRKAERLQPC